MKRPYLQRLDNIFAFCASLLRLASRYVGVIAAAARRAQSSAVKALYVAARRIISIAAAGDRRSKAGAALMLAPSTT